MQAPNFFSCLVLAPAMQAFAQPVTLNPLKSQAGAPPYAASGIWSNKPVDIALEDGGYLSTNQPMLGIRVSDYAVAPKQGDQLTTGGATYLISDVRYDGQGGADLWLRNV